MKWGINYYLTKTAHKEYNDYITRKLDELGIDLEFRKRKLDYFVRFNNR